MGQAGVEPADRDDCRALRLGCPVYPPDCRITGGRSLPAVTACVVTLCGLVPYVYACPRQCRSSVRGCPQSRRAFLDVLHIRVVQLITPTAQRVLSFQNAIDFRPNSPRGLHREVVSAPFCSGSVGATPSFHYRCAAFGKSNVNSLGRAGRLSARRKMSKSSAWTALGMPRSDLTAQRCADFLYRIFTEPSRLSRKYTLV